MPASSRILEIMMVLGRLGEFAARPQSLARLRERRIAAVKAVATDLGLERQTVHDKLTRALRPDVQDIEQFDRLAFAWLERGDDQLRSIVLSHVVRTSDEDLVARIFGKIRTAT